MSEFTAQQVRAPGRFGVAGEHGRPGRTPVDELTPQELRVALLVIDGATNREVGAALFMSPKTVEVHLTHIYRKLGLRSRTELAREMHRWSF